MTHNITTHIRQSNFRGNAMAAFDRLPARLRAAHHDTTICWCPLYERWSLNKLMKEKGLSEDQAVSVLLADLAESERRELQNFAQHWPSRFGRYPHVAAGATIQRYGRRA